MYQVAMCEDEKVFSEALEKVCRSIFDKLYIEYHISIFDNCIDFLVNFYKEHNRYDLILLDIIMEGTNGMELARTIRESDEDAVIIFVTSSKDYVLQGYDVKALHYLMKPIDSSVLERLITLAYNDKFQTSFLAFKSGAQNLRILIKDIIALEIVGRRVAIMTTDRTLYYPGKLVDLLNRLPKDRFIRCHQAFAVNIDKTRELTRQYAVTINGIKIPVIRAFLKGVQKAFLRQLLKA